MKQFRFFVLLFFVYLQTMPLYANKDVTSLLVLYKSSEGFSQDSNLFRTNIHSKIADEDFEITYHDIEQGLPNEILLEGKSAIITYYTTPILKGAKAYVEWLTAQLFQQRKVVIIGNMGAFAESQQEFLTVDMLNRFFVLLGLEYTSNWTAERELLELLTLEDEYTIDAFKTSEISVNNYYQYKSVNPKNESYCIINRKDHTDGNSHIVVKTPLGGMALHDFLSAQHNGHKSFVVDLPKFLKTCLKESFDSSDLPDKRILGLLKKDEDADIYSSYLFRFTFKELMRLGYWSDYQFVDDGLPNVEMMANYKGVVSWFRSPGMVKAESYPNWLLEQVLTHRKVIIIGNYGAFKGIEKKADNSNLEWWIEKKQYNSFFYPFGIEFLGGWTGDSTLLNIKYKDPDIVEKDMSLKKTNLTHFFYWKSVNDENKVFLNVGRNDKPNTESAFIVRTPYGGFAFENYLMRWNTNEKRLKFHLNVEKFLNECLSYQPQSVPKPVPIISHDDIMKNILDTLSTSVPQKRTINNALVSIPDGATKLKRKVLILYNGKSVRDTTGIPHMLITHPLGIVLNYLGLTIEYWDINKGLPRHIVMDDFLGIVSTFQGDMMPKPREYSEWVIKQIDAGRKMVIIGNFGAYVNESTELEEKHFKPVFQALGLKHWDTETLLSKRQKIVYKSPEMMEFEAPLNLKELPVVSHKITSESTDNNVYLTIRNAYWGKIDPVVITPKGGLIMDDLAYQINSTDNKKDVISNYITGKVDTLPRRHNMGHWQVNPFLFFKKALDLEHLPIPDVTTMNGNRIFYTHFDGDGLTNISLIDRSKFASELVLDEILTHYPLPFSTSVITSEIENKGTLYYNKPFEVARTMYSLDNVEAATHSCTHPFNWRKGDLAINMKDSSLNIQNKSLNFDLDIYGSVAFIEQNLLLKNKKVKTFFWSGRCNPDHRALSRIELANLLNLNGGDPVYDSSFPSYLNLSSYATKIDGYWQFHTSSSNDYIYTDGWTKNYGNMQKLVEHFEYTNSPRRIMPLNIYLHFYIGDRREGLDGIKVAYDYCINEKIAPLFASEYVSIVKDFTSLKQYKLADDGYLIVHNGSLRTIRFDDTELYPDLEKSKGVIGFKRYQNSSYFHLNSGNKQTIYLTNNKPNAVYLSYGSHQISDWKASRKHVSFKSSGIGNVEFSFKNLAPQTKYQLIISSLNDTNQMEDKLVQTDNEGHLIIHSSFEKYNERYQFELIKSNVAHE